MAATVRKEGKPVARQYEMNMTSGPLFGKIVTFAFPLMCSGVLQLLFNAADIIVVGRYTGHTALAAVGSTSALINLIVNLFVGLSVGANVLIDVSNDGWFGDTAAPWQHLALTGLRALEQNRWLVRCTNTGISAIFDARGRLVFSGPQFQAQALWAQARTENETSPFHKLFYALPAVCALLLAGLLYLTRNPSGTIRRIQ